MPRYSFEVTRDGRPTGRAVSGREAAAILRRDYASAAITAYPAGTRAPDCHTGAMLRAAIADYPHAIPCMGPNGPYYVRAVSTGA